MQCAQCSFKTDYWPELSSHARTVHRWTPPLTTQLLDDWDHARLTSEREIYDMGGYSAPTED